MEDRPNVDSDEYKHRDALWGLFRAELVYLIEQLKIIRDVGTFTEKSFFFCYAAYRVRSFLSIAGGSYYIRQSVL